MPCASGVDDRHSPLGQYVSAGTAERGSWVRFGPGRLRERVEWSSKRDVREGEGGERELIETLL
jgi:hypothetical protein